MTEPAALPDVAAGSGAGVEPGDPRPDLTGSTEMRRLHPLTPLLKSWFVVAAGVGYLWTQLTGLVEGQLFGSNFSDAGDGGAPISIWAALFVAALVGALGYGYLYWRFTRYGIVGNVLQVQTGVLFRQLVVVPYARMQYVDVQAGPLLRRFGLATVQLHTASAATDARIPGLDAQVAADLRDELARLGETKSVGL